MRFSDSINYDIPKPIKYANSNSSPFNSDESLSDDTSLPDVDQTLSPNDFSPQTSSNTNPHSNTNSPSQTTLQNPGTNHSSDRTVTTLKTNLHHILSQIIEIPKLIII